MTSSMLTYQGHVIAEKDESLSLTDMWKAHGSDLARQPSNWLASAEAKNFIEVLNPGNSGIMTKRGKNGGTFAHWQIAMAYAKYLSPEFHMWCNDVVRAHMEARNALPAGTSIVQVEERLARLETAADANMRGLHGHLKKQVTTPLSELDAYLQEWRWNQFLREKRIIHTANYVAVQQDHLIRVNAEILAELKAATAEEIFVPSHWTDIAGVRRMAECSDLALKARVLNARIIKSLDDFCADAGRWSDSSRSPYGRHCRIWRKTAVTAWLADRGKVLIDRHMNEFGGSNVLQFAKADGEGK